MDILKIDIDTADTNELKDYIDLLQEKLEERKNVELELINKEQVEQIFEEVKEKVDGLVGLVKCFKSSKMNVTHDIEIIRSAYLYIRDSELYFDNSLSIVDIDALHNKDPILHQTNMLNNTYKEIRNMIQSKLASEDVKHAVNRRVLDYFLSQEFRGK